MEFTNFSSRSLNHNLCRENCVKWESVWRTAAANFINWSITMKIYHDITIFVIIESILFVIYFFDNNILCCTTSLNLKFNQQPTAQMWRWTCSKNEKRMISNFNSRTSPHPAILLNRCSPLELPAVYRADALRCLSALAPSPNKGRKVNACRHHPPWPPWRVNEIYI